MVMTDDINIVPIFFCSENIIIYSLFTPDTSEKF